MGLNRSISQQIEGYEISVGKPGDPDDAYRRIVNGDFSRVGLGVALYDNLWKTGKREVEKGPKLDVLYNPDTIFTINTSVIIIIFIQRQLLRFVLYGMVDYVTPHLLCFRRVKP